MQNLDQIRAAAALDAVNRNGSQITKQTVNKLPAMILTNGLLATAAFADERKEGGQAKRPEMQETMNALAGHLGRRGIAILNGCTNVEALLDRLTRYDNNRKPTAFDLQRATSESLAFLGFVKRFARKE